MRKWLRVGAVAAGAIGAYVGYLFASYRRLPDAQRLAVRHRQPQTVLRPGGVYTAMTYNIGYAAYPPSYSFFMAGGKYARAYSAAVVRANLAGVIHTTRAQAPDFALFQEVDVDGDRSRHVPEVAVLQAGLSTGSAVFGQNYDSAYLLYPFTQPIGAARSGLLTMSQAAVAKAWRYALPVDKDYNKLMDLDRAFTVVRAPVAGGKTLVVINVHLSAFTPHQAVREAQLAKLFAYMQAAYQAGDYVVCGGDYNHRVLPEAPAVFHTSAQVQTWTHAFPVDKLPPGFYQPTKGLAEAAVPSARGLDQPYQPGKSFVTLIDGFLLSPNVEALGVQVVDTHFRYSDHNPVTLRFRLR